MTFQHVVTHIVRNVPEYRADIEEHRDEEGRQALFAHLTIHKLSPSVFRRLRREWALWRKTTSAPLFAIPEADDAKWEAFVRYFNFQYLQDVICENGLQRRLFVSLPNQEEEHERSVLPEPANEHD